MFSTASAQTVGTVKLSKSFITTPDGELKITVEDADLNTGVIQRNELRGRGRQRGSSVTYQIASGTSYRYDHSFVFRTTKAPILSVSPRALFDDSNLSSTADTFVDFQDVSLMLVEANGAPASAASYHASTTVLWNRITSVTIKGEDSDARHPYTLENPGGGAFTLGLSASDSQRSGDIVFREDVYFSVTYLAPDVQTAQVRITSTTDTRGVQVQVAETLPNTGKFTRTFKTATAPQTTHIVDLRPGVREDHINLNLNGNKRDGTRSTLTGSEWGVDVRTEDRTADITEARGDVTSEALLGIDLNGDGVYTHNRGVDWIDLRQAPGSTIPPNPTEVLVPSPWSAPRLGWLMDVAPDPEEGVPIGSVPASWSNTDILGRQCTGAASTNRIDIRTDAEGKAVRICWTGNDVQIAAAPGALVRVTYSDGGTNRTADATVETIKPTITVIEPGHKTSTRVRSARLIAEITDADSGVNAGKDNVNIRFNITAENLAGGAVAGVGVGTASVTTVTIPGGVRAETTLTGVPPGETKISWSVTAEDNAGNVATSDQDPADGPARLPVRRDDPDTPEDERDEGNVEPDLYELRVDTVAPNLGTITIDYDGSGTADSKTVEGAITGNYLDDENNAVTDATKGRNTSVRMVFNEALDASTVQADDFRVNGTAPAAVSVSSKHPESVFLTVPAFASDARPDVRLAGPISDTAGNRRQGGLRVESAQDGISPTITVTLNPASGYGQEQVTIEIQSNEALLTAPVIRLSQKDQDDTKTDADNIPLRNVAGLSAASLAGSDLYRATFKPDTQPFGYNVRVDVQDTSANPRSVGRPKADDKDPDAITIEIDKSLPAQTSVTLPGLDPITTINSKTTYKITRQNPFITIEWDSEANEYGRITDKGEDADDTSDDTSTLTNDASDIAAAIKDDNKTFTTLDTHDAVDVTNLKLKIGEDTYDVDTPMGDATGARSEVMVDEDTTYVFNVSKSGKNRLLISARNLSLGTYEMSFNGEDELGNTLKSDVKIKFEIKAPDPFKLDLVPGWNLVSIPSLLTDTAIDTVIPADHPATTVFTYDPTEPGGWLSATRPSLDEVPEGEARLFEGSLEQITGSVAYWILTDSFQKLEIPFDAAAVGADRTIRQVPEVTLLQGWNLIPILDITGAKKFGAGLNTPTAYLRGDVLRAYGYSTSTNRYTIVADDANLRIGYGYWVYMTKAKVLVP